MRSLSFIAFLIALAPAYAGAADDCSGALTKAELAGAMFLHKNNPKLFKTLLVRRGALAAKPGDLEPRPDHRIAWWLRDASVKREEARAFAFKAALTKTIARGFFDLQDRIEREQGRQVSPRHGQNRADLEKNTLEDQRESLAAWVDYLASPHSSAIEEWKKYWILSNVIRLGPWNKAKGRFNERSGGSGAMFPELNREALPGVVAAITPESKNPNFAKLYGAELQRVTEKKIDLGALRGHWRRFRKGSNPRAVVETLDAMNTGWCTAGLQTCQSQINKGDFWIYYSADDEGIERIPRLAIRLEDERIAEVRGVGPSQEIDEVMSQSNILGDKLNELGPEGARYRQRLADMKRMTALSRRLAQHEPPSKDDLRFLYEIDRPIQSFGFSRDPRIKEQLALRNVRADLEWIFEGVYTADQISVLPDEAFRGGVMFHYGDLNVAPAQFAKPLPRRVTGNLRFLGLADAHPPLPELPDRIDGSLYFMFLKAVDQLIIRAHVGGDIYLDALTTWNRLELPEVMPGGIFLNRAQTLAKVTLPRRMGTLHLTSIQVLDADVLPAWLDNLFIGAVEIKPTVVMPAHIQYAFKAPRLKSIDGVRFGAFLGGDFYAPFLERARGAVLPEYVGGKMEISGVTELRDVTLSPVINDDLIMTALATCHNVTFPKQVFGERKLPNLRSAIDCSNLTND